MVDEFGQLLIFAQQLGIVFKDEVNFLLQVRNFLVLAFEDIDLLDKTVVLSFEGADQKLEGFVIAGGGPIGSSISEGASARSIHRRLMRKVLL